MELTINDVLRENGMFSKDIKIAFQNKQLKINGEDLTIADFNKEVTFVQDLGDFVFYNIEKMRILSFLTIEEMFSCDIPFVQNVIKGFSLLRLSKRVSIVIKLK